MNNTQPRCKRCQSNLFLERETDGTLAFVCIAGHRWEVQRKVSSYVPDSLKQQHQIKPTAGRDRRIKNMYEVIPKNGTIDYLAQVFNLKKVTIKRILYEQGVKSLEKVNG